MEKCFSYRLKIGQFVYPEELSLRDAMVILERLRSCIHGIELERV